MAAITRSEGDIVREGTRIVFRLNGVQLSGKTDEVKLFLAKMPQDTLVTSVFTHVISDRFVDIDKGPCSKAPKCERRMTEHDCHLWNDEGPFTWVEFQKMLDVAPGTSVFDWLSHLQTIRQVVSVEEKNHEE